MASITQDMRYRLSLIQYAQKHGVSKTAVKFHCNRQYIYRWLRRYNGTIHSLSERSRRPHSHKNQHTQTELKLIHDMRRRNPHSGLVVFWVKLRQRGYTRSIAGLYRVLVRNSLAPVKPANPKYVIKSFQFQIKCVQIDNGFEFTKRFSPTSRNLSSHFEKKLDQLGIHHKKIRTFTPRHNGKVERSHRKDNEYFYAVKKFYSFNDFKCQLYIHNWNYMVFQQNMQIINTAPSLRNFYEENNFFL